MRLTGCLTWRFRGVTIQGMARPVRIEYEGAVYHVTTRGNQRGDIFRSDQDRERFLLKLGESVQRFDVRLYLYCLMTNHVQMVLETPRGNLSLEASLRLPDQA